MSETKLQAVRHGRFTLHVPGGWTDESTITFLAPPEKGLAAPLSAKAPPQYRDNLTLTVEGRPEGIDTPEAFARAMGDAVRSSGIRVDDVSLAPFRFAGRDGTLVERKLLLGDQLVRQFTAVVFVGPNAVVATASTAESEALRRKKALLELLQRIQLD